MEIDGTTYFDGIASISQMDFSSGLVTAAMLQAGSGTTSVSYSRFGAGTTSHGLSNAQDVLFSGDIEGNGTAYFDGVVSVSQGIVISGDVGTGLSFGSGTFTNGISLSGANTTTDLTFSKGATIHNTDTKTLTITALLTSIPGSTNIGKALIVQAGPIEVAGTATVSYSRFGTAATTHALSNPYDLTLNGQLEVDNTAYFDGVVSVSTSGITLDDGLRITTTLASPSGACGAPGSLNLDKSGGMSVCGADSEWNAK